MPTGRATLSGSTLTIDGIEEDDRGVYQCVASNEAATITAESELMVENVAPRAPYNLSAVPEMNSLTVAYSF